MKNTLTSLLLLTISFGFCLQSCKKEAKSSNKTGPNKSTVKPADSIIPDSGEEYTKPDEDLAYTFPETGKQASDFLVEPDIFEIQYEAEGDLNNDGLADIVFVRKDKKSKTAVRSILVLLQNKDKTYRLDKVSHLAMPIEYNDSDFKIYDTEDISIDKGELSIQLYGVGPSGNLFSNFKYFGNQLILTYIETYNMGAGSHQALYYDVMKGELTQEIINTMKEEMPSEEKTFKLKKEKHEFENTSPDEVIQEAFKKIDSTEW